MIIWKDLIILFGISEIQERSELMRKRAKIRLLQQRRQNEVSNFKDLPDNIPLQLTIGTRVTARYLIYHFVSFSLFYCYRQLNVLFPEIIQSFNVFQITDATRGAIYGSRRCV